MDGIKKIVHELKGTENVYLGIRPYGFHAGNLIPHVIYPEILCEEMVRIGKIPKFSIFVFINDWEQDKLAGPDTKTYPFNIFPLNTSFQYATSPDNPSVSIVDYWEPVILRYASLINKRFPEVSVKEVRNSEMKSNPAMKKDLIYALKNPEKIGNVLRRNTKYRVLEYPLVFAMAICPYCKMARGRTAVEGNDTIVHDCKNCNKSSRGPYDTFDYWFYHKPLAIPRLEMYDIDVCITGLDHYKEGDFAVRRELIKLFDSKAKFPKMLYAPSLMGRDGTLMGKSRGNAEMVHVGELLKLIRDNPDVPEIQLPDGLRSFSMLDTITEEPL
jgi:hypothetical protein